MDRLVQLSSLAKVLVLAGLLMFVFGLVRLVTPYSAAAKVGGYTQNCGTVLAPKTVVPTINCDHGGHLSLDLSLVLGGVVLAIGSVALFGPDGSPRHADDRGGDRPGAYG